MRILYYFLDLEKMMFQWQRYHIVNEMESHGCFIEIISPLNYQSIDEANEMIIRKMRTGKYNLFMTCLTDKYLNINTIKQIKKMGFPTLLFCPDNLVAPYNHKSIAHLFDLVWLTSMETEYLFKRWGCTTLFQPYAANPGFLVPHKCDEEILRVGFIGTPHGSRIDRINTLLVNRIPVTIHTSASAVDTTFFKASISDYAKNFYDYSRYPIGRRLALAAIIDKMSKRNLVDQYHCLEMKPPIPLESLSKENGKYALILSFTDANSSGVLKKPVKIVNLRNFEVPMSGGIQFTVYSNELASYFENDREIVMGNTTEELIEKAKFYLQDSKHSLRNKIRIAARRRAEKDHTWYVRFSKIFEFLGLKLE